MEQRIVPCLWFKDNAEEALNFYAGVFRGAELGKIRKFGKEVPQMEGKFLTGSFSFKGMEFMALEGANETFSMATSFLVKCDDQTEVDEYWEKLTDGGKTHACGWLTDKYGVTWQIIPELLLKLMNDPDKEKAGRVMTAMMKMVKIETKVLLDAAEGR
jgi:predicted 3-demethylubiquinone-9 3-methyltransferase (glyoxalase superfamily)